MENLKNNKKLIIPIILVTLVFILGAAYAWLTTVLNGTKINKITAGTLELTLDDNATDGIDLEYAIPQSNEQGLSNTAYTFTVKNTGSINAAYKLYLEDEEIEGTRIDDSNIKYNLVKNSGEDNPRLLSTTIEDNKRVIENTIIDGNSTNTYSLKLWIDSEATKEEVANKVFKARIKLEAVQSEDSSDDEYEVKGKIEKEEEPKTCEGGSVVVYPGGTTATLDNECNFTIPSLKPGEYTIYYVPSGVDPNRTEEEIKNDPLVIPARIIVGIDPRVIKPAQGYDMILDVTKKPKAVYKYTNSHIKGLYVYEENGTGEGLQFTGCLGGEEAGCKDVKSKVASNPSRIPTGTIVKYEVEPGVEKYFNVLYDKGNTLVMQQRENTICSTAWCSKENYIEAGGTEEEYGTYGKNNKGPITILKALEEATKTWKNVNNQTYTAGQTVFGTGDFATSNTACVGTLGGLSNASQCNGNTYPSFTKTNTKARMITAQEAGEMNCIFYTYEGSTNMSCKKFMNNYLYMSTSFGGTVEDDSHTDGAHNYGYWTMSSENSNPANAFTVNNLGTIGSVNVPLLAYGARAVVVVNK